MTAKSRKGARLVDGALVVREAKFNYNARSLGLPYTITEKGLNV
jgi:hypothetical protein